MQTMHQNESKELASRDHSNRADSYKGNISTARHAGDVIDKRDQMERALTQCHAILVALIHSSDGQEFELSHEIVMNLIGAAYTVSDGALRPALQPEHG